MSTCLWCAYLDLVSESVFKWAENKNKTYSRDPKKKLIEVEEVFANEGEEI